MKRHLILAHIVLISYGHAQQTEHPYSEYPYFTYDDNYPAEYPYPEDQSSYYYPKVNLTDAEDKDTEKSEGSEEKKESKEKSKSPHSFTANISLVSDYRFRGISQTMKRPAIQGWFDYAHESGVYVGTWASNVDGTCQFYNNTSMELDVYVGYKGEPFPYSAPDFAYDFGIIYYYYPGGQAQIPQNNRYDTAEIYLKLHYKWLAIKYFQTLTNYAGINSNNTSFNWNTNLYDPPNGNSRGSNYIEANLTFDIFEKVYFGCYEAGKLSFLVHAGHQVIRHYENLSYTDWKAALIQEFDWFNVFIVYVGTNAKHAYYDVSDNAFNPKKRGVGTQGVVLGTIRTF